MSGWFETFQRVMARDEPAERISYERQRSLAAIWPRLRPYLRPRLPAFIFGGLLALTLALLSLAGPLVYRVLIDDVILHAHLEILAALVALLIGIKVIERLLAVYQDFFFTRFENEILLEIQHALLEHTLRLPKSFYDQREVGYLMSRFSADVMQLRLLFSSTLVRMISQALRFAGGAVLVLVLNWRLGLLALSMVPLMSFGMAHFAQRTRRMSRWGMEARANVSRTMQESLASTELIKSFSSEDRTARSINARLRSALDIGLETRILSSAANLVVNALPDLTRVLVLILGAIWVVDGRWSLGSLLAFLSYLGYVFGPARSLATMNLQLQGSIAALERVLGLFDLVPEEDKQGDLEPERLGGSIEFRDVSFSYGQKDAVLKDLHFTIQPGEHVAIVGQSGVGKTTLVSLLLRFYKPTSGEIFFDNISAAEYRLSSLRKRIGYVAQGTTLLSGSVADNLRYGNPEATESELITACRVARIHDFIMSLPDGYGSRLGERAVNLSAGQRQRLCIARALVRAPDILIFDEPTSSLDQAVEKAIFETLPEAASGKTMVMIAHRPATIRMADRILMLENGRLIASGSYRGLIESCEQFRALVL
jgi:ABC-type bacteriocin/lantibiotic exporter with double-glycine peptidase domain